MTARRAVEGGLMAGAVVLLLFTPMLDPLLSLMLAAALIVILMGLMGGSGETGNEAR